jgi:hypothetical protein
MHTYSMLFNDLTSERIKQFNCQKRAIPESATLQSDHSAHTNTSNAAMYSATLAHIPASCMGEQQVIEMSAAPATLYIDPSASPPSPTRNELQDVRTHEFSGNFSLGTATVSQY